MYKFPFLLIKQRLEQKVSGLKEVDWFLDQYNPNGNNALYTTPANFIEFLPASTSTMVGGKLQQADLRFRIHTVTTNLHENHKRIHDPNAAINHLDFVDLTFSALQGYRAKVSHLSGFEHLLGTDKDYQVMNSIERRDINAEHRLKKQMVTVQEFSCLCNDIAAKLTYTNRSTQMDLKINS